MLQLRGFLTRRWWACVDLNHRARPYQGSVVRFYNDLQDRGGLPNYAEVR
jgi:hypothetical protein